jgi:ABC-type sugar transport system ATPase subunit
VAEPLVELRGIGKSFGSTRALDGVSLEIRAGEVHVLAGENGAGKSTLIRVLSGAISDFDGELLVQGASVRLKNPAHALSAGIAAIHQELSLVGSLSVADNLALGSGTRPWSVRSPRADREHARRRLGELGLNVDPERRVESLPLSVQQELEIARALLRGARVIVMDEPTSALGEAEAERLFSRIGELVRRGAGVVYISHRMEEIFRLADRISVLRDGRLVLGCAAAELDRERLVRAMIGRAPGETRAPVPAPAGQPVLEVRAESSGISFALHPGEIVGLAGLAGSGASELLHALFGASGRIEPAELRLAGAPFVPESPRRSLARGLVLLGNDRRLTLVPELAVVQNATLSSLRRFSRKLLIERSAERDAARAELERLAVRGAGDLEGPVRRLSGGNQQKVALARCLLAEPRVLLLDEPTRGIDVGAKADVYRLMHELSERGVAILLVASELEELIALSHRVLVMHRGRIVDELGASEISRERIVASAMGARAA